MDGASKNLCSLHQFQQLYTKFTPLSDIEHVVIKDNRFVQIFENHRKPNSFTLKKNTEVEIKSLDCPEDTPQKKLLQKM